MLPIPAPIIGSASSSGASSSANTSATQRRRFFIPLIYLGGTASLCYLFLFALVISNENQHHHNNHNQHGRHLHHHKRNPSGVSLLWSKVRSNNSEKGNHPHQRGSEGKRKEEKGKASSASASLSPASSSSSAVLISELQQSSPFHRKTLHSLRKKRHHHHQNGTWRSNPTQIWSGHQDLGQSHRHRQDFILNGKGGDGGKPTALSEVSSCPWIEDEQCNSFQVQFAKKGTFKPRALVSFPGSGNSWLRYLIEHASGYFTGSVYNDQKLFKSGLMGELRSPNDGSTILQKTHHDTVGKRKAYLKLSELMFSYRGVLLIRNPFDALVSHWNFINNKSKDKHRGIVSKSEFDNEKWANYVRGKIPLWTSLITSWIENSQDYLIVLYEEVQKNPRGELIRILEYLNQPVNTTRLDCLMKPEHLEGPFHRAHPPEGASSSSTTLADKPLLQPFPFTITSTLTTSSQQDKEIKGKVELPSSSPPPPHHHDHHSNEQTLFVLDSKKSQRDQQQHPQSSPSLFLSSPASQTITAQVREKKPEEQKEDKFLLLPTSFSSSSISPPSSSSTSPSLSSLSQTISSTPSKHHQQNPDSTSSRMTSRTIPLSNNNNHNHNDPLNNSSILRLDLIIQDNIDKINRFFQQKSIPLQLLYTLRPSLASYYFLQPYNNYTISPTPIISF